MEASEEEKMKRRDTLTTKQGWKEALSVFEMRVKESLIIVIM